MSPTWRSGFAIRSRALVARVPRRAERPAPDADVADALRALVSLLRCHPPRRAVAAWPLHVSPAMRGPCERTARRVKLGASLASVLRTEPCWPSDLPPLCEGAGSGLAAVLDARATELIRRAEEDGSVVAHVAGMKLSARIVGWLPVAFVPLVSSSGSLRTTPVDLALLTLGGGASFAGARWLARLVPSPPEPVPAARLASLAATELRCGAGLRRALTAAGQASSDDREMSRILALVALGAPWRSALSSSLDPDLRALGGTIATLEQGGRPAADALKAFSDAIEQRRRASFDRAVRRAPVKMALPLTLCVLPACGLLGVGPLLRTFGG